MTKLKLLSVIAVLPVLGLIACGPDGTSGPDLVISSTELGEGPVVDGTGIKVPYTVTVTNQGDEPAARSKVSVHFIGGPNNPSSEFVVAFTVEGQSSIWYPQTSGELAPGSSESFSGTLTFNASNSGSSVSVSALADSCSGDEFTPDYCRVEETDETNNRSSTMRVDLP